VCAPGLAPVPVGQVGTFSGVLGTITASARAALSLWATDLNARGGLACHPVRIYSEDDAGDATDVTVSGPPTDVLRWAWNRAGAGEPSAVTIEGPPAAVDELRRCIVTATQ